MSDVFISYSRKDKDFVGRLHDALANLDRDVWIDWEDIPLTADWWNEIKRGIDATDTFVFVISQNSLSSPVCTLEVRHAVENNKRLIPVVIVDGPDATASFAEIAAAKLDEVVWKMLGERDLLVLARDNWQALGRHNWIMFTDEAQFDANFRNLLKAIDTDLQHVRAHTRFFLRARTWDEGRREQSYRLVGVEIDEAEKWLEGAGDKKPPPTDLHREYTAESRRIDEQIKAETEQLERSRKRSMRASVGLGVMLIVAVLGVLGALIMGNSRLEEQRAESDALIADAEATLDAVNEQVVQQENRAHSFDLALTAREWYAEGNPDFTALPLALEAADIPNYPAVAERTLAEIAYHSGALQRFFGHTDRVYSVAFSPDGRRALSASGDQTLILWDVDDSSPNFGEQLHNFAGHTGYVFGVAFSPDGQTALSASADQALILWDVDDSSPNFGEQLHTFTGHTGYVWNVAFSPDGQTALSASADQTLILWDMDASSPSFGQQLHTFTGHTYRVYNVAFSPDGRRALSASGDQTLILWDVDVSSPTFGEQLHTFAGHTDTVRSVAFSPDGRRALSASDDRTLILWNIDTSSRSFGQRLHTFTGHTSSVYSVAFSPDGRRALSASSDQTLILWNLDETSFTYGEQLHTFTGHTWEVTDVAFSPDGGEGTSLIALSSSTDETLILWDVGSSSTLFGEQQHIFTKHTHIRTVFGVAFSPDAVFSPDGRRSLSSSIDETLILWDVDESSPTFGEQLHNFEGNTLKTTDVAFNPDGLRALSASSDETLILWDVDESSPAFGQQLHNFTGHTDRVNSVTFSPSGRRAISASDDETLILWDVDESSPTFGEQLHTFTGHTDSVRGVAFSPNGQRALSASVDQTLIIWDTDSSSPFFGQQMSTFTGHTDYVWDVAFSPDSRRALSASSDRTLILWDADCTSPTFGEPLHTFTGHTDSVRGVAFSPDGRKALSASADNTLILWDVDESSPTFGEQLRTFAGHTDWVRNVEFSPGGGDGTSLRALSASDDDTVILWRIDTLEELIVWTCENRYVRELTDEERRQYGLEPGPGVCARLEG